MTNRTGAMLTVVVMAATVSAAPAGRDGRDRHERPTTCSAETLTGAYTFSITGVNVTHGVQYMLVGQFTTDGAGSLTGKGTQSIQGAVSRQTFTGVYQVDADCSGTATITFDQGVSSSMDFFIARHGKEVRLITTGQGTLESGSATRVASPPHR